MILRERIHSDTFASEWTRVKREGVHLSTAASLKEERLRLGLSQPAFAAVAGATRSAQVKWERGTSAPTAPALAAFAEAGADVLYILTGRRGAPDPETAVRSIEDDLAEIRRDMLDPGHDPLPGEDARRAEARRLESSVSRIDAMLRYDGALMTQAQAEEVASLRRILDDPTKLSAYRAADYAQNRKRREEMKENIAGWFDERPAAGEHRPPSEPSISGLATLALEYGVPVQLLVEIVHDLRDEAAARLRGILEERLRNPKRTEGAAEAAPDQPPAMRRE